MFFYAIDCKNKPVMPCEINPKPKAITAYYDLKKTGDDLSCVLDNVSIVQNVEHNVWTGEEVQAL